MVRITLRNSENYSGLERRINRGQSIPAAPLCAVVHVSNWANSGGHLVPICQVVDIRQSRVQPELLTRQKTRFSRVHF